MAVITGKDLAKRLNGARIDVPEKNIKTNRLKASLIAALAITAIATSITPLTSPNVNIDTVDYQNSFTKYLNEVEGKSVDITDSNFIDVTDWNSAKLAYRDSRMSPTPIHGYTPGLDVVYLVNPEHAKNGAELNSKIKSDFANVVFPTDSVNADYLDRVPSIVSSYLNQWAESQNGGSDVSLVELPIKVSDSSTKNLYVGFANVNTFEDPLSSLAKVDDSNIYKQYKGRLVDHNLAASANKIDRIENSATYMTLQLLSHNFVSNAPRAEDSVGEYAKLYSGSENLQDFEAEHYHFSARGSFSERLMSYVISDAVALIQAAKTLPENEWEGLKLDVLTLRNTGDFLKSNPSINTEFLAHSTNFAIKPLIKFLNEYREDKDRYPQFENATRSLNGSSVFFSSILAESMHRADASIQSKLKLGISLFDIVASLDEEYGQEIDSILSQELDRGRIADLSNNIATGLKR